MQAVEELKPDITNEFEVGYDKNNQVIATTILKEENPLCYCKQIVQEKNGKTIKTYYIKADDYGVLLDPYGLFVGKHKTKQTARLRPNSLYIRVDENCFALYRKYLDTKNKNYYNTCEREIKNRG